MSGKKVVLVGDLGTDHEGFPPTPVVSGSPNVLIDGKPVARVGDQLAPHSKPKHPPHPRTITSGSSTVFINGVPVAITGGGISCGGVTIGSGTVVVGDTHTPVPFSGISPMPQRPPAAGEDPHRAGAMAARGSRPVEGVDGSAASATGHGEGSLGATGPAPTLGADPKAPMLPRTALGPNKQAQIEAEALVELLYVPGEDCWYGLDAAEVAELEADALTLEAPLRALANAQATGDADQVLAAKAEVEAAVSPLIHGPHSNELTEIVRLKGRKYTYVRSDKMRNHWRSYRLDADDRKRRKLTGADGQVDLAKVRKQLTQVGGRVEAQWAPDALQVEGAFTEWAQRLNQQLQWHNDTTDDPDRSYDASAQAQLLRYYAGTSLDAGFNPHQGQAGFNGQLRAELALAEGRVKAQGYYPDARGHEPRFVPAGLEGRHEVQLGSLRGRFELLLAGFAGASALGSAKLEFAPRNGQLLVRGVEAETGVGGSAFAGARLECEAKGHLEWANPDQGYEFKALASAGYGATFSAGAGAEGEFRISFENGRFFIRAKAGLVCGLGATGSLEYAVDAGLIWEFAAFTRHQLLQVGGEYQLLMEDYAYTVLAAAIAWQKQKEGNEIEKILSDPTDLLRWWQQQSYRLDDVLGLADNLKREDDALRYAPPATLGRWLEQLRRALEEAPRRLGEQARESIEGALMRLLDQLQDRLDWRFTLSHMTLDGSTITPEQGEQVLERTARQVKAPRLQRFLAHQQHTLPAVAARNAPLGSQLMV